MRNVRNTQGFTLIELMIVVVIIGILAAVAIPRFGAMSRGAKEAEADPILKQAYTLQEAYWQREGAYADNDDLEDFGWEAPEDSDHYTYSISDASETGWCALAATSSADGSSSEPRSKVIDETREIRLGETC